MATKLSSQDRRILEDALCDLPAFLTPRERQAFVRGAVDGYPLSDGIDRALQWVDWSGGARVVASDLVRLLEGHDVAAGVPALAVIAEAIESLAGRNEKLADLRRRMGWAGPAFFISYASEDVGAARRLFEELKAIGGPVAWFDKSALKSGDSFDAKILDAIRRCACLLPLISRQTEARAEGYFRQEWREGVERSKSIQGRKFLFPVVIDMDWDGAMSCYKLVPEEFRAVQYSHAPGGNIADVLKAELAERLRTV